MDLVPIWYKERYCPPHPPQLTHPGHVKIKVTDLEFSRNKMRNIRRAILSGDRSCWTHFVVKMFVFSALTEMPNARKWHLFKEEWTFICWHYYGNRIHTTYLWFHTSRHWQMHFSGARRNLKLHLIMRLTTCKASLGGAVRCMSD